jgi:hypothetical protein
MQFYTVYLYLKIALHVSGGTTTHHQEHTELYLQRLVFVTPLLLPAAIAAGSSNGLTWCCRYSCLRSWWLVGVTPETCSAVSRYKLCTVASFWIYIGIHYILCCSMYLFLSIVLFVCKCVLYYYHRVSTQLQLNISYHIIYSNIDRGRVYCTVRPVPLNKYI